MKEILEELRKNPKAHEVKEHPSKKNKDGSKVKYIPIHIIKTKLHNLFGVYNWVVTSGEWSLNGETYTVVGNLTVIIDGREVTVSGIGNDGMKKKRDGGMYGDPHAFIPSAESFALSNASKKLGNTFGAFLDKEVYTDTKTEAEHIEHMKEIKELDRLGVYYNNLQPHEKTAGIKGAYKNIKMNLNK